MRRTPARPLLVAAVLGVGLALLGSAGAADPASEAEFKALVEQDAKIIQRAADAVAKAPDAKAKKIVSRNARSGIQSSALILAQMGNARGDGYGAAVRDEAVKIYKAATDGKFEEAAKMAQGLPSVKPAADPKKIDFLKDLGEVTQKEVMHNFLKTSQFGTNAEADIIANAKKATATPDHTANIARRVLAMGELNKVVTKGENAAEKKSWEEFNTRMIQAAEGLLAASKKKASPTDLTKAYTLVNSSCIACHDDFK